MIMEYIDKLLSTLTQATNIAYFGDAPEIVATELQRFGVTARIEHDRSVVGVVKGSADVGIMLACHLDEIGFCVSSIDDKGRLRVSQVGGSDVRILPGQEVVVHGRETLRAYIGAKPPHLMAPDERTQVPRFDELFVDTGLDAAQVKKCVRIGDFITFRASYRNLGNDMRSAKALDNRASVACGILVMQALAHMTPWSSVYFVATSQEEYTGLGGRIHSFRLPVHYAVVVDVSFGDQPLLGEHETSVLQKGPTVVRGGTVPEILYKRIVETAKKNDIPIQIEALPSGTGTDADAIAFNREGIPTCIIGIPLRYMHTPVEVVSLQDIERVKRLILAFIEDLEMLHFACA
jgi:putative aminopeptidase FrvX